MFAVSNMAPVLEKDVGVGTLLWYKGFTSRGPWDCPAIIYRVTADKKFFYVMSLDDMRKQDVCYDAVVNDHSPDSRKDMRLASVAEVDVYLKVHQRITAQQDIAEVQKSSRRKAAA